MFENKNTRVERNWECEKPTSEAELRELCSKYGYTLVRFKHRDRVVLKDPEGITMTLYLRTKLEKIPLSWWEKLFEDWQKGCIYVNSRDPSCMLRRLDFDEK